MSFQTRDQQMPHLHPPPTCGMPKWMLLSITYLIVFVMSLQVSTGAVLASSAPILVVSPSSFTANTGCTYSLGHGWTCTATLSRSDQLQQKLNWSARGSGISGITFTPQHGSLAPGATQSVTINVPETICPHRATLSFKGPGNTVQVGWSCAGPLLTVDTTDFTAGGNCPAGQGGWTCSTNVGEPSNSQGSLKWTARTSLKGVTFTPSGGVLTPGASTAVSIFVPTSACKNATFTFTGLKSNIIYALWNCQKNQPPPPTLTVNPNSLDPTNTACTLDAPLSATYKCSVTLGETSNSQGNANWSTSSTLNGVTFTPASGTLSPGGSASVTIDVIPCQNGTFTFSGNEGEMPVAVSWSCTPPTLTASPASLDQNSANCAASGNTYSCTVALGESSSSQGNVNWAASTGLSGVSFNPSSGTLSPGQSATITISLIPCQNGTFTFNGSGGANAVSVSWSCIVPSPTLTVSPTSLDPTNTTNCALDAFLSSTYQCTVTLGETSNSQGNANWSSNSSLSGVTFTPASGTLQPGGSTQVTIDVIPCQNGSFTFSGNEGETPVSVTWTCTPPTLAVSPTTLNNAMCGGPQGASQCTVILNESSSSQGNVNWSASSDLSGVSFSPATGTLSPGNAVSVTISSIPCQKGSFTFTGSGGASPVAVTWTCANWNQTGYDTQNTRYNPLETGLRASNVSGLVVDWQKYLGVAGNSSPVVDNNMVYINDANNFLDALDITTGVLVWRNYVAAEVNASPAVANGIIYDGGSTTNNVGGLFAFNASTGALLWHVDNSSPTYTPTVANGVVYVGINDGNNGPLSMYAFDANNGTVLWRTAGGSFFAPAVDSGMVFSAAADGNLYALDATTGVLKWNYNPHPGTYSMDSAPTVGNGEVFVVAYNGLAALNETTGAVLWESGPYTANNSSVAFANDTVYAVMGYYPAAVQALDPSTGSVKWSSYIGNYAGSSSAPAIANGVVYVGTENQIVYALDVTNGRQLWSYTTGFYVRSSPSVVNGVLCIGSDDGNLYAFHLPGTTP